MVRFTSSPSLHDAPRIDGARIAILLEHKFIPEEIAAYLTCFPLLGAEVELVARIWWDDHRPASAVFYADIDPNEEQPWETPSSVEVHRDVSTISPGDYDAIIMAANYTSVRLRYPGDLPPNGAVFDARAHVQSAPLVRFFARAMLDKKLVKGALCHGLWILTPNPHLLRERKVICHSVVMADIINCGADIAITPERVVTDDDLVTGFSKHETLPFIAAIASAVAPRRQKQENSMKRRILIVLSEWGFWGEELIGPLDVFDAHGYETVFCTPTGKRPRALPPSMDETYVDPPLGKSVTTREMAARVRTIDSLNNQRLDNPRNLSAWFPERPYWSGLDANGKETDTSPVLRQWETYYRKRSEAQAEATREFDAVLLVGGSGPMVDMVNNYRVHDLILGFVDQDKPIAAECYGVACLAQARDYSVRKSIIWGKHVTGHALEYDYKDNTGVLDPETGQILTRQNGNWVNLGSPFYTLEYMLRDATGPDGQFHGNVGHATSVIVDYPFITGRSTPDSTLTGEKLIDVLEHGVRRFGW